MRVTAPAFLLMRQTSSGESRSLDESFDYVRSFLASAAESSDVFAAHEEILDDPLLRETIELGLTEDKTLPDAIDAAADSIASMFAEIDDEYLRSRADDVRDVCGQLARAAKGENLECSELPEGGCILVAEELFPSDLAHLDLSRICGIICHRGSSNSHVCIIARSKGIPVCMGAEISAIEEGSLQTVDDPLVGSGVVRKVREAGRKVYANAGSVSDVQDAIHAGADGIGLFRTEFLFLGVPEMPSHEEQREIYRSVIQAADGHIVTFRTLDAGGDKEIPWMKIPKEQNPFLGLRGIRLCLAHPEVLKTQLEAIEQAAADVIGSKVRVMFPMVNTADEVRQAKALISGGLEIGCMIETPACVMNIADIAKECSFASIGTNDLTQYTLAADRCSESVSYLYDHFSTAVRKMIEIAVRDAHAAGMEVGICGELASDPSATDFLIGSGIDSFSLNRI